MTPDVQTSCPNCGASILLEVDVLGVTKKHICDTQKTVDKTDETLKIMSDKVRDAGDKLAEHISKNTTS